VDYISAAETRRLRGSLIALISDSPGRFRARSGAAA
jgi:hypothetical protein